jgi:hypothetical protein
MKMVLSDFDGDIYGLLRPDTKYDQKEAFKLIKTKLIKKILPQYGHTTEG